MKLSNFGKNFTSGAGILTLMDDLGKAIVSGSGQYMLGGGNPAHIPEVQYHFRSRMKKLLENGREFEMAIGNYTTSQGDSHFIKALAGMLKKEFGWDVGPDNIVLTNGSQSAFFYLFNMFAGKFSDGSMKKILLPLAPEYIGYADLGLEGNIFKSVKPQIEFIGEHVFKYHVDFNRLQVDDDIGAICVSRPTNPTGNVITDEEVNKLSELAREHGIPLIVDNAYGTPFPNIIFNEAQPIWDDHIVLSMSLSKLGLPGTRTGIVIAEPEIVRAISSMNAIFNLAPGNLGACLASELIESGEIIEISRDIIKPFYYKKSRRAFDLLSGYLHGTDFFIHKPEGALFLWLWLRGLPITSQELYCRLKDRGVIVVSGHYFFPGLEDEWRHRDECLRITFAQDDEMVDAGLKIIAEEVKKAYEEG